MRPSGKNPPGCHVTCSGTENSSHRGNSALRAALHMAVLSGLRCNPVLRNFYQRLRSEGKAHLTATTACMAKLLRIVYACVLKDEAFDPDRHAVTLQKHLEVAKARQAKTAAAAAAPACLTAPITRREARKRRMAADAPQTERTPHERGHAAAGENHSTEATPRPTEAAAAPSAAATLLSKPR